MKRIFAKITTACFVAAALFATGCLSDDIEQSSSSGGTAAEPVIPDNSVIESAVFEALNLDYRGLEAVKSLRDADQYYLAAQALLEYYRGRTDVPNNHVSLIAPSISAAEQAWADHASSDGKYRFYVEGYDDGGQPYSYANGSGKLDWTLNSADEEQHYRVHRHAWMLAQGKAYRTSLDESYALGWIEVYESWLDKYPLPAEEAVADDDSAKSAEAAFAWRPIDVAYRLESQCDLIYYFMQSSNLTPQLFARFLANVAQEAEYLSANYSEDEAEKAVEAHAVFRAGLIFPEMVRAAEWKTEGAESMNEGIDMRVFDVLDLDFSGLAKVKTAYDQSDYGLALDELLAYYRTRPHDRNPNVDLNATLALSEKAKETAKKQADYAFKESGYRFYVKNFYDPSAEDKERPYSYMNDAGDGIDWNKYTGKNEQRWQLHRHQWMVPQAKTYYTTKEEKYVENWMEVYADWIRQNPKPEQGTDVKNHWSWRPLDVAARLIDQCALLEYYQDSPTITVEWLVEVLIRLDEHANHIMNNYSETTNHLITQAQAVTFAGMLFPELKNSAVWKESGSGVLNREVTAQYFPDGWLKEGDLHYHIASISDFRTALRVAQLNGGNGYFPSGYVEAMRSKTNVVMNMIYPDYTVPNMGDTRRDESWSKSVLTRNLKEYCELFPDNQEMLWLATEGKEGSQPQTNFVTFPDAGYYVMRTGWTEKDMMMVLQNAPAVVIGQDKEWHRQWDNNTFELWVKGRNFFPDSGCFSYAGDRETNANRAKYAATSAHNTMTLDGKNLKVAGSLYRNLTEGYTMPGLTLENLSYEGLTHRRTVYLVDNKFYVLLDEAIGDAAGTVNLNFHLVEGKDTEIVYDNTENGCHTAFADNNNMLVRTFPSKECTFHPRDGFVSYKTNESQARKSYQLDVVKTADEDVVRFVTVLLPTKDASERIRVEFGDTSFTLHIGSKVYPDMKYTYTK